MDSARLRASSTFSSRPSLPGMVGTPTFCMVALAVDLSPIERIDSGEGPTKVKPWSAQISANLSFSARKP